MTLQLQLNNKALNYVPRIKQLLKDANEFERDQMRCKALSWINSSIKPINAMSAQEIKSFEDALISVFTDKEWIKK